MRRLDGATRASGASRHGKALQVKCDHESLRLNSIEVDAGCVRYAAGAIAVRASLWYTAKHAALESIAQYRGISTVNFAARYGGRAAERNGAGHVLRTGPATPLMTASEHD